ncbi:peptidoglycan-binding protein [Streptomyces bambusae]|uniref:peptidoglycan-binding domain-containing protein n=1 Tax=Streptomyces bambusae TaxID=1550616 RepID=UPI001CFE4903|nr:peptidoglycan-binding domain-containing protein [Streptomyces bambusae]MCB5164908.1 peptidoglycan-binding protein [Streptomyces bambusae]
MADDGWGAGGALIVDEAVRLDARTGGRAAARKRRRSRVLPLAVGAAVVVIGAGLLAAGLSGDEDGTDRALPDPKLSPPAVTVAPDRGRPSATGGATDSGGPTAPAEDDAAESPEATGPATATASASARETRSTGPSPEPTRRATRPPKPTATSGADSLRRGDDGSEVRELQIRLNEMAHYWGPMNGRYTRSVERAVADFQDWANVTGDPRGVYGPATREALEALSHEP